MASDLPITADSRDDVRPRNPRRRLSILALLSVATVAAAVIVHALNAKMFYEAIQARLTYVDEVAVTEGLRYLASDPQRAVQAVRDSAISHGVATDEIGFIETAQDGRSIGMSLNRKMPAYVTILSLGVPQPIVSVTAWAHLNDPAQPEPEPEETHRPPLLVASR